MTSQTSARIFGALLATSVLIAPAAFANGQGTPVEPAPAPAPTVMQPEGPAPAVIAPPPPSTWQGFYIGANIGYAFQSKKNDPLKFDTNLDGNFNDTVFTSTGADAFSPGFCNGKARGALASDGCKRKKGGIDIGVRAGYDVQFGSFVIGGLLDGGYVGAKDAESGFSTTPASYTFERKLKYLAAGRLRAGVLVDPDWLIYGTGGIAYGDINHSFSTTNTANSFGDVDDKGRWGYQVGGGVETMIAPSISLGVEYLYTSLKDDKYTVLVRQGTAPATNAFLLANANGTDIRRDDRFNIHTVRATISYHFNE